MIGKRVKLMPIFSIITICLLVGCSPNQKFVGKTFLNTQFVECPLVLCPPKMCCSDCFGFISFATDSDTLKLYGNINGKDIGCSGNTCDLENGTLDCTPFEIGKRYEIIGKRNFDKNLGPNYLKVIKYTRIE